MSLVNNMLRDLDQRRKDSNSSGGSVKLMPARDYVSSERKGPLPYVLLGLVVVAAALAFYWTQMGHSNNSQSLDIRVQPMASSSAADSQRLIDALEASITSAELAANNQPEPASTQTDPANISSEGVVTLPPIALDSTAEELLTSPIEEVVAPEIEVLPEVANNSASTPASEPRSVRGGPIESVKEAPEFSSEQLDTIAVQTALRQIADGQTEAADVTLEDYILANRFAHQSRETYAKLLMSRGRIADANALIDAGLSLAPNHAGFKKVKARLLMANGELRQAVDILISRAPAVSDDTEYHDLLASAQLSSRDFSGAIISYTGLVQSDETQGKWWYGFAAAHDQLGNTQPARQAYSRAMQFGNLSANLRRRSQERLAALNP